MYRFPLLSMLFIAPLMLLLAGSPAIGAALGVHDSAKFFSDDGIAQAEQIIHQINQSHHKDVRVETFPEIPSDMRGQYEQLGKERFYDGWASQLAKQEAVDGVLILITRDPGHLQVWVGNHTQQRLFPLSGVGPLKTLLANSFKQKQYDEGLLQATQFIQHQMDANAATAGNTGSVPPARSYPQSNTPPTYFPSAPHTEFHFGGIACLVVGVILFIVLVRAVFGRAGGGSYGRPGGYYPPQGGYPPGGGYPTGGYPPQGGYGGGGGGFGTGFLEGLLGGAVGGYAADKWMGHGQAPGGGFIPPSTGGGGADFGSGVDTSGTSSGADFGSSGPSGGADFGSSGGGADFGGGGGGGSDFGGGGGGGDSGGSSGSDF